MDNAQVFVTHFFQLFFFHLPRIEQRSSSVNRNDSLEKILLIRDFPFIKCIHEPKLSWIHSKSSGTQVSPNYHLISLTIKKLMGELITVTKIPYLIFDI